MTFQKISKILYPIYHFLPCASTQIHRVLRFLNYLAATGKFEITVLTCENPNDILYDESLMNELNVNIRIIRTKSILFGIHGKSKIVRSYLKSKLEQKKANFLIDFLLKIYRHTLKKIFNMINIPDNCIGWLPFAFLKGKKLFRNTKFEIIFSTGPPFTNFLISALLKDSNSKLVIDYRDPWTSNYYMERNFRANWQLKLSRKFEEFVLKRTDFVIANTEAMKNFIISQNKSLFLGLNIKIEAIYNGFNFKEHIVNNGSKKTGITFIHSGRFHGKYRTPKYLLNAMRNLIDPKKIDIDKIKVVFLGNLNPTDFELIKQIKTDDFCEFRGTVSYTENFKLIDEADCLVVIGGGAEFDGMFVPSKIFEYLQTDNMILGLLPKGEAYNILEKSGGSVLVAPENEFEIEQVMLEIYNRFLKVGNLKIKRNSNYILENFDANKQCKKLEQILLNLLNS